MWQAALLGCSTIKNRGILAVARDQQTKAELALTNLHHHAAFDFLFRLRMVRRILRSWASANISFFCSFNSGISPSSIIHR